MEQFVYDGFLVVEPHNIVQTPTRDRIIGADGRPWCPCHRRPMRWRNDKRRAGGGGWRCSVSVEKTIKRGASQYWKTHGEKGPRNASPRQRARVRFRDGYCCVYCGSRAGLEIDHVWPYAQGGPTMDWNLVTACRRCNEKRNALRQDWQSMVPEGWEPLHPLHMTQD